MQNVQSQMVSFELCKSGLPEWKKVVGRMLEEVLSVCGDENERVRVKDRRAYIMELFVDAHDRDREVVVSQIGLRRWARLFDLLGRQKVA